MILYNVTIKVDWSIHNDWLQWMKEVTIPGMLNTGFFINYQLVRLLQVDDSEGPTYAVQYFSPSMDEYNRFVESEQGNNTMQMDAGKWNNKMVSFSTLMEVVY